MYRLENIPTQLGPGFTDTNGYNWNYGNAYGKQVVTIGQNTADFAGF
jgi:hypothetical protein